MSKRRVGHSVIPPVLWRRGWIVVVAAILGGSLAFAVVVRTSVTYSAQSVLVVPAVAKGDVAPGEPDKAQRLAATYAKIIPQRAEIVASVAKSVELTVAEVISATVVTNESGTGIIYVSAEVATDEGAVALASAWSAALASGEAAPNISPGSIQVVSVPSEAVATEPSSSASLIVGFLAGALLGVGIAWLVERSRPRIDNVRDARRVLGVPTSETSPSGIANLSSVILARCMEEGEPLRVSVAGISTSEESEIARVTGQLEEDFRSHTTPEFASTEFAAAGILGRTSGAEHVIQLCDFLVLVAHRQDQARLLIDMKEELADSGVSVHWIAVLPRGGIPAGDHAQSNSNLRKPKGHQEAEPNLGSTSDRP